MARYWDPPSDRVAELIRVGAGSMLDKPKTAYEALDTAVFASSNTWLSTQPRLMEALRAAVRANFAHWATANIKAPGMPVTANLGPENVDLARDVVRHGFDSAIFASFHAAQNAAVQLWTVKAFEVTRDPDELQELLDAVVRSIFAYIDDTHAALNAMVDDERGQFADVDHAARMEAVGLILEGAPIGVRRASQRLRYELDRHHLAAIVWSEGDSRDPGQLERAVTALVQATGATRPLTILTGPTTMWVWISMATEFQVGEIREVLAVEHWTRMAIGTPGSGLAGFRRSHLDALVTQRIMRSFPPETRIATYDEIEVVALATADMDRAIEFVSRTLGPLVTADRDLRETLRIYLREGLSTTQTAKALYAHRNTIINRLDRARALLPHGLEQRTLQIALALEMAQVIGPPVRDPAPTIQEPPITIRKNQQ
ncbi:PucR family transcriptional regulator [Nocardia amikacinitolerans]|uniref:PucR family transcriptional regulator n=1 Tax=Nocardia amikacinitolerans TaxID=756689 RepID=UPI0020A3340F|nr:helix-turn-helix domain-containing protein [Nocardia amikacinitolerans]MCP2281053.1 DNA-binding transcriptional regulator, PucR family [Nocardia amikacinitolerans]